MNPNPRSSRALRRAVAVATTLAVSTAVVAVPVVPGVGVQEAAAQVAPKVQPGVSHGVVRKNGSDWEANVVFSGQLTVRSVAVTYIAHQTGNTKQPAVVGDPAFTKIPEVDTYRVEHYSGRKVVETFTVTGHRSTSKSDSQRDAIQISYDLPKDVKTKGGDQLRLIAVGKGSQYPLPWELAESRFTKPTVSSVSGSVSGTVRLHNADGTAVGASRVRVLRNGSEVGNSPVAADGSYQVRVGDPSASYTVEVVPPAGFATPGSKTWTAGQGVDFDVLPINVNGRVVDGNGAGVAGAKVTVGQRSAVSDQNGYFTVTKVPTGTYTVQIGETNLTQGTTIPNFTVRDQQSNSVGNSVRVTAKQLYGKVSGTITDDVGRPVGDARVVFKRGNDTNRFGVRTDGSFSYSSMKDGVWDVWIESTNGAFPDTHAGSFEVKADPNQANTFNGKVALYRGTAAASVSGPVEPVEVVISGGPEKLNRATMRKVNGRFEKANLLPGTYTVEVTGPTGYTAIGNQTLQVKANEVSVRDFSLSRQAGRVSGRVANIPSGNAVTVRATGIDATNNGVVREVVGITETFSLDGVPTGQYRVEVLKVPRGFDVPKPVTVKVDDGQSVSADFSLTRQTGSIAGTLSGAPEDVLNQVKVTVSGNGQQERSVEVRGGKFSVPNLPTGSYTVTANAPANYSFANGQRQQSKRVDVGNAQAAPVSFAVSRDTGVIEGTVTGGTATIGEVRIVGNGVDETVQVTDGKFRTRKLPTGRYTVTAKEPAKHTVTGGGEVTVTKNGTAKANFTLQQLTGSLSGSVNIQDWPQGIPDGTKVFVSGEDLPRTEIPLNNGAFRLQNLVIGDYRVEVQVPKGFTVVGQNPRPVKVEDGKTATPQIDVTVNTVPGTVKVTDDAGRALANAEVELTRAGYSSGKRSTGSNGEVRIDGLKPGSYSVAVSGKAGAYSGANSTLDAKVGQGGRAEVKVKSLNNISGVVLDDLGNPVKDAVVTVNGRPLGQKTNANGQFDAGNRSAGTYTLQVQGTGTYGQSQPQTVTVVAGKDTPATTLRVALKKGSINVELDPAIDPASVKITGGPKAVSANAGANSVYPGGYTVSVATPNGYATIPAQQVTVGAGETKTVRFGASVNAVEVSAKVIDDLGNPVTGAAVKFGNQQAKTDATGVARVSLKPGSYTVTVPGSTTHRAAESKTLSFKAGEKPTQLAFTQNVIRGGVRATVSGDGSVDKLTISGGNLDAPQQLQRDGDAFVAGNLVPGVYTLSATAAQGSSVTGSRTATVTVAPSETASATLSVSTDAVEVTAKVVDDLGNPVNGATVKFGNQQAKTDANGVARVSLKPGSYTVTVPGSTTHRAAESKTLSFKAGEKPTQLAFTQNVIRGGVRATVSGDGSVDKLTISGGNLDAPQQLRRDGDAFVAGNLVPGEYTVTATVASGYAVSGPKTVEVKPDQTAAVDFAVAAKAGSISGRVVGHDPETLPVQRVELWTSKDGKPGAKVKNLSVDASGNVSGEHNQPGDYIVRAVPTDDYRAPQDRPITIKAGEPVGFGSIQVEGKNGRITGTIAGPDRNPLKGSKAELFDAKGEKKLRDLPVKDGVVNATDVRPGSYQVRVIPPAGFAEPKKQSITVAPNREVKLGSVKLAEKNGRIGGTIANQGGNRVDGTVVELQDANGKKLQELKLDARGRITTVDVKPGTYKVKVTTPNGYDNVPVQNVTVERDQDATVNVTVKKTAVKPTPTPTTTAPKPSPKPSPPRTSTTPTTTSTTQAPVPDVFSWDELKVAPGEVRVVAPKRETTNNQDKPVTFEAVEVVQKAEDGTTKKVEVDQSWLQVEENGTVVAKPPAGTAPGVYELKIKASTSDAEAEAETVTIVVTETVPMKERYTVKSYEVAVPAGTTGRAGTPRAEVKDGSFTYADRALPAGTEFELKTNVPGANVDKKTGRVTYNPPANAKPGRVDIPVTVTFPDGSTDTFTTTFVVGEPLLAVKHPLRYARTSQAPAGQVATAEPAGTFPKGTTFALRSSSDDNGATARGNDLNGWLVSVDPLTGKVRAIAPDANAAPLTVPVVAIFTDGSSHEYEVTFHAAPAAERHLQYSTARAARGETVALTLAKAPKDASFTVLGDATDFATVNPSTGALSVTVPDDAAIGQELAIRVGATHPDGLAEETEARVFVIGDVHKYNPVFDAVNTEVGESAAVTRPRNVPAGTRFEIPKDYKKPGWTVQINEETGEVTARADSSVGPGERIDVPVNVIYPDGSSEQVAVGVGAVEKQEAPAPTDEGSSIGKAWIAIVLGVLAAIGGVGAALFMNQDEVRRVMAQFGF